MPFTLSHPAAVLPFRKVLRRCGFSALAIGSMAPDFPYFVGAAGIRWQTHDFPAIAWFCVPVGLAVYLAFQRWLRAPAIHLLPEALAARLTLAPARAPLHSVVAALALGAATHVLWDSFTHEHQPGVMLVRGLNALAIQWLGLPLRGYNLLQHGSTLLGALALVNALRRWLQRTPPGPLPVRWEALRRLRTRLPALLAFGIGPASLLYAWLRYPPRFDQLAEWRAFVGAAVVNAISLALAALLAYAVWWRLGSAEAEPIQREVRRVVSE